MIDYQQKYLKYKAKYIALKNQKGGNGKKYVEVTVNSGTIISRSGIKYTNQCMWISILDYLKSINYNNGNIDIDDIRNIASSYGDYPINLNGDFFDSIDENHLAGLNRVCDFYSLRIIINAVNINGRILYEDMPEIIGNDNAEHHFRISKFGNFHFQYVTNIIEINLNTNEPRKSVKFKGNLKCAIPELIKKLDNNKERLTTEEYEYKLHYLLEFSQLIINLEKEKKGIESLIKEKKILLTDIDHEYAKNEKENEISSFLTNFNKLINEQLLEVESIEAQIKIINKNIDDLLS